ncbi:hypothetical protein TSUD_387060 [Trifolium subterraneum]|uniref:Splicing factor U2af large subunit n=2 Tax=Trifolium TaxID=3898 RepID=A0A2Z6PP87_TRISU|nr:hypothetical protein TSUD_387060 [Trifolium subterraneum]
MGMKGYHEIEMKYLRCGVKVFGLDDLLPSSRGSGHESSRMRRRDGDRKSFHDHRDRHRDDKYEGFKGRGKYDSYNRQRGRDYDRHNDYDRDRDTRSRYGAHSKRSRRESRSRSRSRSPSQSESKRTSGFDMAPPATGVTPTISGQMPGIAHMIQGATQNFSPYGISQIGALSLMQVQPMTQQATRHARRVYVGGLPPFTNEQAIASFFSHVMLAIGGNSAGTGVGVAVRVRRPTDYNPSLAAVLGPCQPSSNLNLSAVGLTAGSIGGAEGLDRIFVGGLPYYFTEVQMRELLQAFGPLRNFDIVRDKDTGNSKGYGFCIYQDPAVTDIACASLNGLKMGDKTLTVRRATVSGHAKPEEDNIFARAQQHIAMQARVERIPTSEESPTKVLCLTQAVTTEQLTDNGEYEEILEDMRDECRKFGTLMNVVIPRPNPNGELSTGIGKVFLEYSDCTACLAAKNALNGRKFGGNTVTAVYYPEEKYHSMEYDL